MLRFRWVLILFCFIPAALFVAVLLQWHSATPGVLSLPSSHAASALEDRGLAQVVAPGLVEPVTKELHLGFEISGVVEAFYAREGEYVVAGQPLVRLRQEEYVAQLEEAEALMLAAKAEYTMYLAGSRPAEIDRAANSLERAKTWLEQAQREAERRVDMLKSRSIGIEELERARRDVRVADAELQAAAHTYALLKEGFRGEEIEKARHRLVAAEAKVRQVKALLEKTRLCAPVAGRMLRVHTEPGEAYSIFSPVPVVTMGDTSTLNVRVEVDERDVARIQIGQAAFVVADSFGGQRFTGRVTRTELNMTPKRTRSGDPSEPVDRSVLEALITLDAPGPLYSGMRVDSYIQITPATNSPVAPDSASAVSGAPSMPESSPAPPVNAGGEAPSRP